MWTRLVKSRAHLVFTLKYYFVYVLVSCSGGHWILGQILLYKKYFVSEIWCVLLKQVLRELITMTKQDNTS